MNRIKAPAFPYEADRAAPPRPARSRRADITTADHRPILAWTIDPGVFCAVHERATRSALARRVAGLLHADFGGELDPGTHAPGAAYLVPSDTLLLDQARAWGVRGPHDLLGGVVPARFVATKAITHPLVMRDARRPPGWSPRFGDAVQGVTLRGFTAFSGADAWRAAVLLLARGAVRLKPAHCAGGQGQCIADDEAQLARCLAGFSAADVEAHGLAIEENIQCPQVRSVGQIQIGALQASYHGLQRETRNHRGQATYGGSDLCVVRGGFEQLLQLALAPPVRCAIEQAWLYHRAVLDCYPGFFASRINYDLVQGVDARGDACSGVLEQSWRIGGATSAEVTALEAFQRRPGCCRLDVSCVEAYGAAEPPQGAAVHFRGTDPEVGALLKYAFVHADAHPA